MSAATKAKASARAVQAASPKQAASKKPPESMLTIIAPSARDRWSSATISNLTPARIESILRGAISGSFVSQWELFDLMEDTWYRLKKNLNEVKRSVQKVELVATPYLTSGDKEPSPRAKQKRDLLEFAIWNTLPRVEADENSFEDAVYDLCDAVGKGVSIQETLWETRETPMGTAILPRAWQWVYPRHYGYVANNPSLQLSPQGDGGDYVTFPKDQFVIGTFKTKTGHLLTSSLLRSLAMFWIGANFSYDWMLNFAQMFGIPIRWAEYDPQNPKLLSAICDMLENLGSAGWGAFPAGTKLTLHEAVQRAADNPQSFLMSLADIACDILILGQTLTTSVGASGSRALGEVHQDVRADVIEHAGAWVAKTFNYQFVPALMRLNFGDNDEDPYLVAEIEQAKDAKAMADRDKVLAIDMRMPMKKSWLYDRHDVPMPDEGDDLFEPPAPAPSPMLPPSDPTKARAVHARAANDQLIDNVLEGLTGVQARWLGGVRPYFAQLVQMAQSDEVTDDELLRTLEAATIQIPELFDRLDHTALEAALYNAMSAATVNGAVTGFLKRGATKV